MCEGVTYTGRNNCNSDLGSVAGTMEQRLTWNRRSDNFVRYNDNEAILPANTCKGDGWDVVEARCQSDSGGVDRHQGHKPGGLDLRRQR